MLTQAAAAAPVLQQVVEQAAMLRAGEVQQHPQASLVTAQAGRRCRWLVLWLAQRQSA